jgi:ATP adenylyltransferase
VDYLWTPWRYQYVTGSGGAPECVFCAAAQGDDRTWLVVHRTQSNFVILNRYPYTNGHVMIVPVRHVGTLNDLSDSALADMMMLARDTEVHLRRLYRPDGVNLGLNIGQAAVAGIADHVHMHALPRWFGDTNFMTVAGETRVLPETLEVTWERLRAAFAGKSA